MRRFLGPRLSHLLVTRRTMGSLRSGQFVGALDCGTTSTRFIIFDEHAAIVAQHQVEFTQYYPHPGWHEHEPEEIIGTVRTCISEAVKNLEKEGWARDSVKTIGITNQRETCVAWDRKTGKSLCRAIVWDDARTKGTVAHYLDKLSTDGIKLPNGQILKGKDGHEYIKKTTGLPISTYFSAIKLKWMMHHYPQVVEAHEKDQLAFGTVDSWICWHLLDPAQKEYAENGGLHITDPTNASRTLLLSLSDLKWHPPLLEFFELRPSILPKLVSSSQIYGHLSSTELKGVSVAGIAGDQQAALVGNKCLQKGEAKCTYGTGAFLLFCTGNDVVRSRHGLLTTVAFQPGEGTKPVYAMEGSIAVAGSAIKWLRDGIKLIRKTAEVNTLAESVEDTGGVVFVTAFGGLLAPYWDPTAAGMMIGLTSYTTPGHIARATLEASAFQTRAILESMHLDAEEHEDADRKSEAPKTDAPKQTKEKAKERTKDTELKVDGGMTNGDLAMQILADLVGCDILRPEMRESTALGAALLAGSAISLHGWNLAKPDTFAQVNSSGKRIFRSSLEDGSREERWRKWQRAIERSRDRKSVV